MKAEKGPFYTVKLTGPELEIVTRAVIERRDSIVENWRGKKNPVRKHVKSAAEKLYGLAELGNVWSSCHK